MRTDRILNKKSKLYHFLTGDSANKQCLVQLVRERIALGAESLALCLRGDYVSLYYRGNQLLKIHGTRTAVAADFDFRHARFTPNYREILQRLNAMKVDSSRFCDEPNQKNKRHVRFHLTGENAVSDLQLKEILKIYMQLVDDFVDPTMLEYAFDPKNHNRKSSNLEYDRKQQLFSKYFFGQELVYYDLEYAEHDAERVGVHGRYDLLGLAREGNGYTLLFVELKSKSGACNGKSGIVAHEGDYVDYLDSRFVETRKKEACENIKILYEIFKMPPLEHLTPDNIKQTKIKFVFSDSATRVGRRYVPQDERIEKVFISENALEQRY